MTDPFVDVDAATPDLIAIIANALEVRAADPDMLPVIDAYLDRLAPPQGGLIVEIGCGTGGVTRRIADRLVQVDGLGVEPSVALTEHAHALSRDRGNLKFRVGDGAALDLSDCTADIAVLHKVLSDARHPLHT